MIPLEIEGSEKIIHATGIFQQYNCILWMGRGGLNNPSVSTGVLETARFWLFIMLFI
jgi:hypothetical protein